MVLPDILELENEWRGINYISSNGNKYNTKRRIYHNIKISASVGWLFCFMAYQPFSGHEVELSLNFGVLQFGKFSDLTQIAKILSVSFYSFWNQMKTKIFST